MKRFEMFTEIKLYLKRMSFIGFEEAERDARNFKMTQRVGGRHLLEIREQLQKFANFLEGKVDRQLDAA